MAKPAGYGRSRYAADPSRTAEAKGGDSTVIVYGLLVALLLGGWFLAEYKAGPGIRICVGLCVMGAVVLATALGSRIESGYTLGRYHHAILLISENLPGDDAPQVREALRLYLSAEDPTPKDIVDNLYDRRRPK